MARVSEEWVRLPFREAVDWFRSKVNVPTQTYRDLTAEHQERAFAVAGVTSARMLADLRAAVDKSLAEGTSLQEFRRDFDRITQGWDYRGSRPWRTELILNENLRRAYGRGRLAQLTDPDTLAARPWWRWRHGDSIEPRKEHLAWDGTTLRANHPWFADKIPPAGFGCKCRIQALRADEVEQESPVPKSQANQPVGLSQETVELMVARQLADLPVEERLDVWERLQQRLQGLQAPAEFVGRQAWLATVETAFFVVTNGQNLSPDQETAFAQLVEYGLFNFGVNLLTGNNFREHGLVGDLARLVFSGANMTRAARALQDELHRRGAQQILEQFGPEAVEQLRRQLAHGQPKYTQRTYYISGLGDSGGHKARETAQMLSQYGLEGQVVAINNPSAEWNFFPETLVLQTWLKTGRVTQSVAQQVVAELLENPNTQKLNLVGFSSGANIAEGVAAILNQLGVEVDDVITWGAPGLAPNLGQNTRNRRYFSNADFLQIVRVPEPGYYDRFFEGVLHNPAGSRFDNWRTDPRVLKATVADLNEFLTPLEGEGGGQERGEAEVPPTAGESDLIREQIIQQVGIFTLPQLEDVPPLTLSEAQRVVGLLPAAKEAPRVEVANLDLNTATTEDLLANTPLTTRQVASLRRWLAQGNRLTSVEDLLKVPDIGAKTVEKLKALPTRIDLNNATLSEIRSIPGVSQGVAIRILQEAQRQPFVNAADVRRRVPGVGLKLAKEIGKHCWFRRNQKQVLTDEAIQKLQDFTAQPDNNLE